MNIEQKSALVLRSPHERQERCSHEIEAEMLAALKAGVSKPTHIMARTNLNAKDMQRYEAYLLMKGYAVAQTTTPRRWELKITALGEKRLSLLKGACA